MSMGLMDFLEAGQYPSKYIEPYPWMEECSMELVTTKTLSRVMDECIEAGYYGCDVETTGLDTRVHDGQTADQIVGLCLASSATRGYYIPVAHKAGQEHNIPLSVLEPELARLFNSDAVALFHNAGYDQEIMEFTGGTPWAPDQQDWDSIKTFEDTQLLFYLNNSRTKRTGLKYVSEHFLDCKQIELEDLFPEDWKGPLDYSQLDPSHRGCVLYGASDGIVTVRAFERFYDPVVNPPDGRSQKNIYQIEKGTIAANRWMKRNEIPINPDKLDELIVLANKDLLSVMENVYAQVSRDLGRDVRPGYFKWLKENFDPEAGDPISEWRKSAVQLAERTHPDPTGSITRTLPDGSEQVYPPIYDLFSPQQLGQMFEELGVPNLKYTEKSQQVATGSDEMDRYLEESGDDFPWMKTLGYFRSINTALSNFLMPIKADLSERNTISVSFRQLGTDTGRFATKKPRERMKGWPQINFMSTPSTYNDPDNPKPPSLYRMREIVCAREGYFIVAIDFSGEELRIVTNLSGEPIWVHAFFSCIDCGYEVDKGESKNWPPEPPPSRCPKCGGKFGDLHSVTGDTIFPGERENLDYDAWAAKRQVAKIVNFQCCYGGGGGTVSRSTGLSRNEGWRIVNKFKNKYKGLVAWWEAQVEFAKQYGYVQTPFGRRYPVPDIQLPVEMVNGKDQNKYWRSKAERNAINGPVQATGSDIIKIAMSLIYRKVKKKGLLDEIRMIAAMHDELVFEIKGEHLEWAIPWLADTMTNNKVIRRRKWPVPFTYDAEFGKDWTVPYDYKDRYKGKYPEEIAQYFSEEPPEGEKDAEAPPDTSDTEELPTKETQKVPTKVVNGTYIFDMRAPMTSETAHRLADVIVKTKGGGTRRLQIRDKSGKVVEGWEHFLTEGEPVYVNDQMFEILARDKKL